MESEIKGVRIIKIISETKHPRGGRPRPGYRRVQAVVRINGQTYTRHGDTIDGEFLLMKRREEKKNVFFPSSRHNRANA